jgi:serine/threonine-protein kinase haspin
MILKDWKDILPEKVDLKKIAEASYAEVYRVNTIAGSSILKIMRIKLPELPDSLIIETAIDVNSLISEIRIMNALTTVPGFVTFKDAHLVSGHIPSCLRDAVFMHRAILRQFDRESYFPALPSDKEEAWFLVVELGDAGDVLDECELDSVEKFWDVFIGVTIALARAEIINQFEVSRHIFCLLR